MQRFIQCSFLALSILMIIACSNKTIQEDNTFPQEPQPEITDHDNIADKKEESIDIQPDQPHTFTHNGQEFEIIPFYTEFLEYIAQAREEDRANWYELYRETVKEPFHQSAWRTDRWIDSLNFDVFLPSYRLDELEESVYLLIEKMDHINDLIAEALKKSSAVLPDRKTKVYVIPSNPENYENFQAINGVSGAAYNGLFVIQIEPQIFSEDILQYTVAHEYHHTINRKYYMKDYRSFDFLESVLTEGKADTFAKILYPDAHPTWIKLPSNEEHVWEVMKKVMDPQSTLSINFFFGDRAMNIPPWSNYRIGYQIMQDFIKNNPDVSIEEWTKMKATDILELSRFEERFED